MTSIEMIEKAAKARRMRLFNPFINSLFIKDIANNLEEHLVNDLEDDQYTQGQIDILNELSAYLFELDKTI